MCHFRQLIIMITVFDIIVLQYYGHRPSNMQCKIMKNDYFLQVNSMELNRILIFWLLLLFLKIILNNLFGKIFTYSLPYWLLLKLWCPFECCIIIKHQSPIIRGDQTDNPFVIHHGAKRHHTPWWVIKPLSPENSPWIKRWETSFNSRPKIVHLQPLD